MRGKRNTINYLLYEKRKGIFTTLPYTCLNLLELGVCNLYRFYIFLYDFNVYNEYIMKYRYDIYQLNNIQSDIILNTNREYYDVTIHMSKLFRVRRVLFISNCYLMHMLLILTCIMLILWNIDRFIINLSDILQIITGISRILSPFLVG